MLRAFMVITYCLRSVIMSTSKVIGHETRHLIYCKHKQKEEDLIVVNRYTYYEDGHRIKNMHFIRNYEREFYIVNKSERKFNDKQQWLPERMMTKYKAPQCRLHKAIGKILGKRFYTLRDAFNSPYVYGCGSTVQSDIKKIYVDKWESLISPKSSVAVVDLETNVFDKSGAIILATISMKDKVFTAVTRDTTKGTSDSLFIENTRKSVEKYLDKYIKERNINHEIKIVDNEGQAAYEVIQKAHEWQPDFLIFWNMDFDLPKIINALKKYDYDLAEVFSDPRIPKEYKWFSYKPGSTKKLTQDGTTIGLAPYERWHIANCPATFFMACAMTTYYRLRIALGKLPGGYGLDATLARHLNLGKLKFSECDHLSKYEWHAEMQSKYIYEYIAYNVFDCIGVELLDEKNLDFSLKFNTKCKLIDYTEFKSAPVTTMVKMNYLVPEYGYRLGVVGDNIRTEVDNMVVGPDDWTMVLPAYTIEDSGVSIISDWSGLRSLVYFHVSDSDISSTYPAVQAALNISKSTTTREVVKVEGLNEVTKRRFFVDLTTGIANSAEICHIGLNMGTMDDVLDLFNEEMGLT